MNLTTQGTEEEDNRATASEIDCSEYFQVTELFNCRAALIKRARDIAERHGVKLVIGHTFPDRVYLTCDRFGKKRKNGTNTQSTKFTGTKKCNCGFQLKGTQHIGDTWELSVVYGKHNHELTPNNALFKGLSHDQYDVDEMLTKSHVKPKRILAHLRRTEPGIKTTLKRIYNAKTKMKKISMGGKTVMQHLMQRINENKYIQRHRIDQSTKEVIDLMFSHPRIPDLLKLFPYVLLMDSTYKTNRYKMSLLEIVGVTPVGKNFTVAIAFMKHEK